MSKAPAKAVAGASSVKIEEGTATAADKNVIAKPKAVTSDTFGNKIEEN